MVDLVFNDRLNKILAAISYWSEELIEHSESYKKELNSASNFISDETLTRWTFGKSVGKDGQYHRDGGQARIYLMEKMGFLDALSDSDLRDHVIQSFKNWAVNIKTINLAKKLEKKQFRLLIPPLDWVKSNTGLKPNYSKAENAEVTNQNISEIEINELRKEINELKKVVLAQPFLTQTSEIVSTQLLQKYRDPAFRVTVREIYNYQCVICAKSRFDILGNPEVQAAHIYPKSKDGSDDPRNGITLCRLHHWAFDGGLISLSDDLRVLVVSKIKEDENYQEIWKYEGKQIIEPAQLEFKPESLFLKAHRELYGFE